MENQDLQELILSLGLGEIPILNTANHSLHDELVRQQLEQAGLESDLAHAGDEVDQLSNHVDAVHNASVGAKYFIAARKEELETEKDLNVISENQGSRNKKDLRQLGEALVELEVKAQDVLERIEGREVFLDLLDGEFEHDSEKIRAWSEEAKKMEKDIELLLKFHLSDESRIKQVMLKVGKLRETKTILLSTIIFLVCLTVYYRFKNIVGKETNPVFYTSSRTINK